MCLLLQELSISASFSSHQLENMDLEAAQVENNLTKADFGQ